MWVGEIQYREIPNFEGYLISKCGKILSAKFIIPREMKTDLNKGYKRVCLSRKNVKKNMLIHRLLAMTFLKNYTEDLQVDHKDNNPLNNNLSNLRMVTPRDNYRNKLKFEGVFRDKYYWRAYYRDDHKPQIRYFNVNTYGEIFAYLLATECREEMVDKYYNRPS